MHQVRRFGGSGGIAGSIADCELMQFMADHNSSSPLTTKALKIVRRMLGYDIYYISAKET